ncbi:leucyl aminopeptidase [Salinibacillus xinjiangensis]|uniref:Probable cytosol aminopeptidase n=1 Tax=Salinibacillus xinjiangensis TaxID=1229268 RepID=A0A6G1X2I5_9BACI|nr:leucyl aminopeptidase [Salinibacillus xinjiangensis]MRG85191.1 leucyl aminopeptidase [Salinibacillus xinjiangensis]
MFTISQANITDVQTKALILGLYQDHQESSELFKQLNNVLGQSLKEYEKAGDLSLQKWKITKIFTFNQMKPERLYIVGLGKAAKMTKNELKNILGKNFKTLQQDQIREASIHLDSFQMKEINVKTVAEVAAESMVMAQHKQLSYKTKAAKESSITSLTVLTENKNIQPSLEKGYALGKGVTIARNLTQLPGNILTATKLAEKAKEIAETYDMEYEILDREDMENLGMGALLAVNQGSVEPPKMIVLSYQGLDEWKDATALIGKGITFDTGGYSIKSKDGIVGMKTDMGGAAAVLGAMETIGRMKPKKNVLAVIPSTDNMISGGAFKPDDVITSLSGKTIEVRNTDAEGRLALADAVTYAKRFEVSEIVDVATLTGGVIVALGDKVTGAMTNNDEFFSEVEQAAQYVGEPIWQLPYTDLYKEGVRKSDIADLNNSPGRKAHAVMAGSFIGDFAEDTPWVHLDIAGTATTDSNYELGSKGPTGVMSRTLAQLILQ